MTDATKRDPRIGVKGKNTDRGKNPVRGVRVEEDLWSDMKVKAESDGTNRNSVLVGLMRGYVAGKIALPED